MADGALRADVIRVLCDAGASVDPAEGADYYRVSRGNDVMVIRLRNVVSRTAVDKFHRAFGIPKTKFFPNPIRIVAAKASGGTDQEPS